VNLAYGASALLGIYCAIWAHQTFHISPVLLAPIAVLATVIAGVYVERLCFAPHVHRAAVTSMAASFAVWMQLEEGATLLLPQHTQTLPAPFEFAPIAAGSVLWRAEHALAFGSAALVAFALWWLLYRSRYGLGVRAMVDHRQAAACVGIDVRKLSASMLALASALGGVAGYLIVVQHGQVTPMFAMWVTLKGMLAAMFGGLGSLAGAVAGGLLLGLLETHGQSVAGPQYRDLLGYVLLLAMLALCPAGLSRLWRRPQAQAF
jgi:branched-chain amino acid transport system permease protein